VVYDESRREARTPVGSGRRRRSGRIDPLRRSDASQRRPLWQDSALSLAVGADIESLCAKCGDVWHVVVAMVGAKVAKVQCKQCGGYHRHKSKDAPVKAKRTPKARAAAAPAAPTRPAIDPDKPIRPYRMAETFEVGDQIEHVRFGVGVVESAGEPGKIAVLFDDGRKVLAAAKREQQLATANDMVRASRRQDAESGEPS